MVNSDDHAISVRLPEQLYEQLRRFAFDKRISQANVVRKALEQFFAGPAMA